MPDLNGEYQVFLMHVPTRALTLVTRTLSGGPAAGQSAQMRPKISADGRFIAFVSHASTLVANDNNPGDDVFRYDHSTASLERISAANGANFDSRSVYDPAISGDGTVVAFATEATNVVPGEDPNAVTNFSNGLSPQDAHRQRVGGGDIFVFDFKTQALEAGSVNALGERPLRRNPDGIYSVSCRNPSLTFDGTRLVFDSDARDLVAFQSTFTRSAFLRDRNQGKTFVLSYNSSTQNGVFGAGPSIDPAGRRVFFVGAAQGGSSVFVRDTAPDPTPTPTPTRKSVV